VLYPRRLAFLAIPLQETEIFQKMITLLLIEHGHETLREIMFGD
jgi:hypothetical protein